MKPHEKQLQWLERELPNWVQAGLIDGPAAARIRAHYGASQGQNQSAFLTMFGVIGAVLVGVGIILLLAYNWYELSRGLRAALAIGLLVFSQALVGWSLIKKPEAVAWREGGGSFLVLSIGAAIALVGQTYHLSSNLELFLLTWMLLSLPLVYLLRASLPAVLYTLGTVTWYFQVMDQSSAPDGLFWLLWCLPLPWCVHLLRSQRYSTAAQFLTTGMSLALAFGFCLTLADSWLGSQWAILLSTLFTVFFLGGNLLFHEAAQLRQNSLRNLGGIGLLGLGFTFSSRVLWAPVAKESFKQPPDFAFFAWPYLADTLWLLILPLGWLGLVSWVLLRKEYQLALWGLFPLVILLGQFFAVYHQVVASILLMNGLLLAIGVMAIVRGIRDRQQGQINGGLLIMSLLCLIRFVDADMGLLARGIAFILVGLGFLVANLLLMRKLKKGAQHV